MEELRARFGELLSDPDVDSQLDLGALLIAKSLDQTVSVDFERQRLDTLASSLTGTSAAAIARELFDPASSGQAFRGNARAYYDRDNSLLPRVLDRRLGIPISLSIVMIEVARRRGVEVHGVGMPGHFLVGTRGAFIDPFNDGVELDAEGCRQLLSRLAGRPMTLEPTALAPTPAPQIWRRMLHNLSNIGAQAGDRSMLRAVWALLSVFPAATARDHVRHAYAASELGQFGEAAAAGERAAELTTGDALAELERTTLNWRARLN